ncbi:MAG: VWA domain-containing protein [Fulvivirga sp.]
MQRPQLIFEYSPALLLICALAAVGYAFLLYQKKGPWSALVNKILFGVRAVAVFIIASLLVSPILKQLQNTTEKATYIIAVDNSTSLTEVRDSAQLESLKNNLSKLSDELTAKDYNVELWNLEGKTDAENVSFNSQSTNLTGLLNDIKSEYESRNLNGVLLVSDGIYNLGMSPAFANYNFDINTLGVGDTLPKTDISLTSVLYNRLSYQGNKFPVIAQIQQRGFDNEQVKVTVSKSGATMATEVVNLKPNNQIQEVRFLIEAKESGYQRYSVSVERKDGELTYQNNVSNAYVEVVEGKEAIAIVAAAPHPDIKALKSAIETNANYELDEFVLSNNKDAERLKNSVKKFDLVILHQLPNYNRVGADFLQKVETNSTATLTINGPQTDIRAFSRDNDILNIRTTPGEYDNVTAIFNPTFSSFKLSDDLQAAFDQFPPLYVPFGKYEIQPEAEVLLYQRVGNINSGYPLLIVKASADTKKAVMMGPGIWKWKLTDYANFGNNNRFNELVVKLVQYLSTKDDKRKFRVYPTKNEYLDNESVVFETEIYNDLFERVYNNKIDLTLVNEEGEEFKYDYITSESNSQYIINGLTEGVYKYNAATVINGKTEKATGELLIKNVQLESVNLTADFNLLRKISSQTGGNFYKETEFEQLTDKITSKTAQGIIHTNEEYLPFINLKLILILILVFISFEWFMRKYSGSY